MRRPARHPLALALYINAALLFALLIVLLSRSNTPRLSDFALGQALEHGSGMAPIAGGGGLFMMPAQFSENVWGCYIMDVDRQVLCAYSITGNPPQLRLVASRDFRYDHQLKDYNTQHPTPLEVKNLVEKEQTGLRAAPQGTVPAPSPEAPH